jgi:hypothetical protein
MKSVLFNLFINNILFCSGWVLNIEKTFSDFGSRGHHLTSAIGQRLLSKGAYSKIDMLIPDFSFEDMSTWADTVKRKIPWSSSLHYVNPQDDEPDSCSFVFSRDCPDEKCIVGALYNYTERLDPKNNYPDNVRIEALKFFVKPYNFNLRYILWEIFTNLSM